LIISFPPFEPDKAIYNTQATGVALNVAPVADGWAPLPSFVPYASALPSEPKGSITARTAQGVTVTIAGTKTHLYRVANNGALTDVSSATYDVPDGDEWSFALYGSRIIATNLTDVVQYYDIGTSTDFADLPGSPPKARFAKVVGDFLVLFQLDDDKSALHWSGINNSEQWVPGEELSDRNSFPDGEELQAISVNGSGATLAFRKGFRTMNFSPDSGFVFTFSPYMEGNGCAAPLSMVDIGRGDFVYYSDTGFYRGIGQSPIGAERVDTWITTVSSTENRLRIKGVADPFRKIVFWRYQDDSTTGYLLGYSWQLDRWFQCDTAVLGLGVFATSALTLEELDELYPSGFPIVDDAGDDIVDEDDFIFAGYDGVTEPMPAGIDSIPFSLDSPIYNGSAPSFAGFDMNFRLGFFSGLAQQATVETGLIELSPGGRTYVDPIRAISDAPVFSIAVGASYDHSTLPTWSSAATPNPRSRLCNFRSDGRLHKFRMVIPAEQEWNKITALDVVGVGSGQL